MGLGMWTLKCQNCNATFELQLSEREQITEIARSHACPECRTKPEEISIAATAGCHRVIGFRAPSKQNRR